MLWKNKHICAQPHWDIVDSLTVEIRSSAELLQSCLTFCNPLDCSPPGSCIHGIIPARILEWVAIFSSRGSFQLKDRTHISCSSYIGMYILYHWATWEALELRRTSPKRHPTILLLSRINWPSVSSPSPQAYKLKNTGGTPPSWMHFQRWTFIKQASGPIQKIKMPISMVNK